MNEVEIVNKFPIKYFGIIIDQRLTWANLLNFYLSKSKYSEDSYLN